MVCKLVRRFKLRFCRHANKFLKGLLTGTLFLWLLLSIAATTLDNRQLATLGDARNSCRESPDPQTRLNLSTWPRINQTTFSPGDAVSAPPAATAPNVKHVLLWTPFYGRPWGVRPGRALFSEHNCPRTDCSISEDRDDFLISDAVLFNLRDIGSRKAIPRRYVPQQLWILMDLESPLYSEINTSLLRGIFNLTSTYSSQSDLPVAYGGYEPRNDVEEHSGEMAMDLSSGKTRLVAWFVSNCKTPSRRMEYVQKLQQHIRVDIYGACGKYKCHNETHCWQMLRNNYKFYIAFENSNCKEYITEKFWLNSLENSIVPIVMGPSKADYERLAPPNSFIHVSDFSSVQELARFLKVVNNDRTRYSTFFKWKQYYKSHSYIRDSSLSGSPMWCELCVKLHSLTLNSSSTRANRIDKWWSRRNQCGSDVSTNKLLF